jgi:hypothetical protein
VPDQPLLAVEHLLASDPQCERTLLRVADVAVSLPQVERIPERGRGRAHVFRLDARVLRLHQHGETGTRLDVHVEAKTVEPVDVVSSRRVADIGAALHAIAELAAHRQPFRRQLVEAVGERQRGRTWTWHLRRALRRCLWWSLVGLLRPRGGCREPGDRQRERSDCEMFRHVRYQGASVTPDRWHARRAAAR